MVTENLTRLGLSEKEAMLYLMLLRSGPLHVSLLARKVQMKRVSLYPVLDSLCERGLVTFEQLPTGRRYIPHDPECLLYNLEQENAKLKLQMELAKECILTLQKPTLHDALTWQKIVFHRGARNVEAFLEEMLQRAVPVFILFLNGGDGSAASVCLEKFLKKIRQTAHYSIHLCVPETQRKEFEGGGFTCHYASSAILSPAEMLLQGDRVVFMFTKENEVELMLVKDLDYAAYVKEVLLVNYFK